MVQQKNCEYCGGFGEVEFDDGILDIIIFNAPLGIFKKKETCPKCNGTGKA